MNDMEILRQAHLLLGQYGFAEEQEVVARAIRIIAATTRRIGAIASEGPTDRAEGAGDRLKRLRERAGLSRSQFAGLCDVLMTTVRAHENGQAPISTEAAHAYATALGTTPEMILRGRD
jgi:DNA-binding XRE family transcriptional regulator